MDAPDRAGDTESHTPEPPGGDNQTDSTMPTDTSSVATGTSLSEPSSADEDNGTGSQGKCGWMDGWEGEGRG